MTIVDSFKNLVRGLASRLGQQLATPETDPERWFSGVQALPNPDPILRRMGRAEQVYFSIATDPHVLGDIRSIRGNFRSQSWRVLAGDEGDSKSVAAQQLCQQWMARHPPNHLVDWLDLMWQQSSAFLTGYRVHERVWQYDNRVYLPQQILDRPSRRIQFDAHGNPLLISRSNMLGEPITDPYLFVISRHMADSVNPYGVAVLSACFWSWTFKTGGWKYFVKYCERHGLPWPVGRYPMGTNDKDVDKLEAALASMIEAGYIVAQDGTSLELLTPTGNAAGGAPQQHLIDLANREMSKALTGQAMVAELQGAGARAASETALKRQESIDDSVRDIAAQSMADTFKWITLFNFGDGVAPPTLEFYKREKAGKERAETYKMARDMGARPSKSAMLEELGIPEAKDDADALVAPPAPPRAPGQLPGLRPEPQPAKKVADFAAALASLPGWQFARAAGMTEDEAITLATEAADQAIEDKLIAPVAQMLAEFEAQGRTLDEFQAALADLVGELDDTALREVLDRSLTYAMLRGAATQAD